MAVCLASRLTLSENPSPPEQFSQKLFRGTSGFIAVLEIVSVVVLSLQQCSETLVREREPQCQRW